jgi:hypothetical protein
VPKSVAVAKSQDTLAQEVEKIAMGLILLIIVILLLLGGLPRWNHSRNWGYGPSGLLSLVLVVLLVLIIMGQIPRGF